MVLLDGKKLSEKILAELKTEIAKLNYTPILGIVAVGKHASEKTASSIYIEQKKKVGNNLGVNVKVYSYPDTITTKNLRQNIAKICRIPKMRGVIIQLPLPSHINAQSILDAILPKKDVDVLGREQSGKFYINKSAVLPPTASGIIKLLEEYKIPIEGVQAVVVGYGKLVGKPMAHLLARQGATITVANSKTKNLKNLLKNADIIVSGAGVPNLITKDMVKKGAVVIDAGTAISGSQIDNRESVKTKLVGDVAPNVSEVAGYIAPVPGGVGPMTVAMLFFNLVVLLK